MWTARVSVSQPARHSTPYRSGVPSLSDQKLKLSDEMRKIQLRHSFVSGSPAEYGSGGQMWRGWVRHARGVYDSAYILSETLQHTTAPSAPLTVQRGRVDTYIFSSLLYPVLADLYNVRLLARRSEQPRRTTKGRLTSSAYSQPGTTGLTTLVGNHRIGSTISSPHNVCLHKEGLMGLATDNMLLGPA